MDEINKYKSRELPALLSMPLAIYLLTLFILSSGLNDIWSLLHQREKKVPSSHLNRAFARNQQITQ